MIVGGIRSIARVTGRLVPVMALLYVAMGLVVIGANLEKLPWAFAAIVRGVYARAKAGTASAANADAVGALADTLLDVSMAAAETHAAVVAGTVEPPK